MWLVRFAIKRPHSVFAMIAMTLCAGILTLRSMPVDLLPAINLPAIGQLWLYSGLSAIDMERRVVNFGEQSIATQVDDVARIESRTIQSYSLIRTFFHPDVNFSTALTQLSATALAILRYLPAGMMPPITLPYNAGDVPVIRITVSSDSVAEERLKDYCFASLRPKLLGIPGLTVSFPYGGRGRLLNIDVEPLKLSANGLSAADVYSSMQASNLVLPAGTVRMGKFEYSVALNSFPETVDAFEQIPIRSKDGTQILLSDVSVTTDSPSPQSNTVRLNGKRAIYIDVLKKANSSTIDTVNAIKTVLPTLQQTAPKGIDLGLSFDQSGFVKSAIANVFYEALLSTVLVSLMIMIFLRSWRSAIVVCTSIPISTLFSVIMLHLTNNTINLMTLGGLSMAIGMLVDDATVEVENIYRNRSQGLPLMAAVLTSAEQVSIPAIISTLSICIVFAPVFFLTGPARFLFIPMALAVVFSMFASYFLSRTLVPLLSHMMLGNEKIHLESEGSNGGVFKRINNVYLRVLDVSLKNPAVSLLGFVLFIGLSSTLFTSVGSDLFPKVDAGLIKFHFRAPSGTRIEETEKLIAIAEQRVQKLISQEDFSSITSMIGAPSSLNILRFPSENIGGMDAEILVVLKKGHRPTKTYVDAIRSDMNQAFPGCSVRFLSSDLISQVLNFNTRYAVDVQIDGGNFDKSIVYARALEAKLKGVSGLVDVGLVQVLDSPSLAIKVDRNKAHGFGITQRDVANEVILTLTGSASFAPSNFITPQGSLITVSVQVAPEKLDTVSALLSIPISPSLPLTSSRQPAQSHFFRPAQTLGNIAKITQGTSIGMVTHLNAQRSLNIAAGVEGRDMGSTIKDVNAAIANLGKLDPGFKIHVRGQAEIMDESFVKMTVGLLIAIGLVYLLMLALYQSFVDPLIVMTVIPASLAGVLWVLAISGTSLNVQSMMGTIMSIGIATANSILLVTFANDYRKSTGATSFDAALAAGRSRVRPVLMTALAMAIGMLPAALELGEGGEQMAPLGRAVLGGLAGATLATLLIVPIVYSVVRRKLPPPQPLDLDERASA